MRRKPSSPKELITVKVKRTPIKIMGISQAKLHQDIFKASFSLLISPKEISEEKVRFVLDRDVIRRGQVIILYFL